MQHCGGTDVTADAEQHNSRRGQSVVWQHHKRRQYRQAGAATWRVALLLVAALAVWQPVCYAKPAKPQQEEERLIGKLADEYVGSSDSDAL